MAQQDYFYIGTTPLNSTVVLENGGTAFFAQSVLNSTGAAIQAKYKQDILIATSTMISGTTFGLHFLAPDATPVPDTTTLSSKLNNQGSIYALSGTGVQFSGGGMSYVTNQGSIVAKTGIVIAASSNSADRLDLFNSGSIITSEVAVTGGHGDDTVLNSGTLRTTGTTLVDLGAGNDIYDGSSGSAFGKIVLGAGDDKAYGGTGSEIFSGGAGKDYMDGGAGSDTVDYSDADAGINVDLRITTMQSIGGGHDQDILISIENVIGGIKNDTLIGSNGDNALSGGDGNDTLEGGLGNDILDGGEGTDWVRYTGSSGAKVDLGETGLQNTSGYGWDILLNIENVEGGLGSDTLIGSNDVNKLVGYFGNDNLSGNGGNDTLDGGSGDDILDGGADEDSLDGGSGNDSVLGGANKDTLIGGSGNDTLQGGDGDDNLQGGEGNDMAVFLGIKDNYNILGATADENTSYTVTHKVLDEEEGSTDTIVGAGGVDTLKSIRVLKFLGANPTDDSDDVLYGVTNSAAPTTVSISGSGVVENSAVDTIVGTLSGVDADGDALTFTLLTNAGGLFKLDPDGKTIRVAKTEGLDFDTNATFTIKVRVSDGIKNLSDGAMTGTAERDVVIKLTNVYENANVVRYGTAGGEQVVGEYGHDWVYGLSGDDSVFGRSGNDYLYGHDGNDYVIGGDGTSGTAAVGTGNDFLSGGNGRDNLFGGDGADRFVFDARLNVKTNIDAILDFNVAADTIQLSRSIFTKISKGTLSSKAFVIGNTVKDKYDRIVYLKDKGALFYDPDGTGKAKAVQFATIQKNLKMTYKDFYII